MLIYLHEVIYMRGVCVKLEGDHEEVEEILWGGGR